MFNIIPKRHISSSLPIHPYFGKVDPALASTLILTLSNEKDVILDPFSGSGTVLHEAILSNRSAEGWDSSPLACLIAECKLLGITDNEIKEIKEFLEKLNRDFSIITDFSRYDYLIPEMRRVHDISKWFTEISLNELSFIKYHLIKYKQKNLENHPVWSFLRIAFSSIIIKASNQKGESHYSSVKKNDFRGRVVSLFNDSVTSVIKCAKSFTSELGEDNLRKRIECQDNKKTIEFSNGRTITLVNTDSRKNHNPLPSISADLVVSSPPYLMSWDYGLYHKFRFYWLDFNLDEYEDTEIGRHLRRQNDDIERYKLDMTDIFSRLSKSVKNSGRIALINAPSIVHGQLVDTNEILSECANEVGWKMDECVESIDIPGPHHGMYGSLEKRNVMAPGKAGKKEHVLIFSKRI